MKTSSLIILFFSAFLICGCSNNELPNESLDLFIDNAEYGTYQNEKNPPFSFELFETITPQFPEDFILSGFQQLLTDPQGNIYFMDAQQSKLISINSDGTLRWMTGEKGRGPGDFESAYSMITDSNRLYIGNLQGARIDAFDYNGNFLKSYNLAEKASFGTLWGTLSNGDMVLAAPNWESWGPHIHIIGINEDSVEVKEDFMIDQSGELETIQGMTSRSSISVYNDEIHTGSIIDYSIETRDINGDLIRKIRRDFDRIVRPGMHTEGNSSTIRQFGRVGAPRFLPNGFFIVNANWPTNIDNPDRYVRLSSSGSVPEVEYANSIDIYDPEGQLVYSFEEEGFNPEFGPIVHIDKNGIIYTTSLEPEPVIKKLRINVAGDYSERISF
jgi:hypothetical protein